MLYGTHVTLPKAFISLNIFVLQKIQQLRQTESTLHRRQAEYTAILVAKDTAQQQADEAEAKVGLFNAISVRFKP